MRSWEEGTRVTWCGITSRRPRPTEGRAPLSDHCLQSFFISNLQICYLLQTPDWWTQLCNLNTWPTLLSDPVVEQLPVISQDPSWILARDHYSSHHSPCLYLRDIIWLSVLVPIDRNDSEITDNWLQKKPPIALTRSPRPWESLSIFRGVCYAELAPCLASGQQEDMSGLGLVSSHTGDVSNYHCGQHFVVIQTVSCLDWSVPQTLPLTNCWWWRGWHSGDPHQNVGRQSRPSYCKY